MQPTNQAAGRYDRATIFFHWLVAILVAAQWLGAQTIDWFPRGPWRVDVRSMHIVAGVLLLLILLARVAWRLTGGRRLPPLRTGPTQTLATAVHLALYLAVFAMLGVGIFAAWARGDSLFNLVTIPAYDPGNHALGEEVVDLHGTIGWIIIALVGLHAAAALVHHYVWRDGLLRRMDWRA
jgi:cytochrome b561